VKLTSSVLKIFGISIAGAALLIAVFLLIFCLLIPASKDLIAQYPSEDGNHELNVYLGDGGATTSWTTIAEVRGKGILFKRVIYVQGDCKTAEVVWINDHTVRINGIALDIFQGRYTDSGS
jgi:hypothetical protein